MDKLAYVIHEYEEDEDEKRAMKGRRTARSNLSIGTRECVLRCQKFHSRRKSERRAKK